MNLMDNGISQIKKGVNYYIFKEGVVVTPYTYCNYKATLSLHDFFYNKNINGLLVQNLFTDKHYRNNGYATKLLNYVIATHPNDKIFLYCLKNNKQAIQFYNNRKYKAIDKTANIIIYKIK